MSGGRLLTVESHSGRYEMAARNFSLAGVSDVVMQVAGHAPEIFPSVPEIMEGGFDMVFMDATKGQHGEYYRVIFDLLKPGALVVVDNVLSHAEQMHDFLEMISRDERVVGEVVRVGDGLWVGVKL